MNNDLCNDCKPAVRCEVLTKDVDSLKNEIAEIKSKVSKLETLTAVNEEQTKMVFKILSEIKDSIEKIANKIDEIENRPNNLLWTVLGTLVGALIMAGLKFLN